MRFSGASGIADRCAACESRWLVPGLRAAGDPGPAGLAPSTTQFGTALSDIVRCQSCGHMQLARPPTEPSLLVAYQDVDSVDYVAEETGQRTTARSTLEMIEQHASPGRLLDVGCWVGFLLDEARHHGWEVTGVEPSRFASSYARERFALDVYTGDLVDARLEPGSFDAVVLEDVIEHLPDPGQALDRIAELTSPGAVLHLALPDAGSRVARVLGRRWWSVIPTHVHYFTRGSMSALLQRHGWQVIAIRTAPKAFTLRYYLGRLAGYSPPLSCRLIALAEAFGAADRLWAPDFRDRMAVMAQRAA